jgi:hypothetical protein
MKNGPEGPFVCACGDPILTAGRGLVSGCVLSDWPPAVWQQLADLAGALHGQLAVSEAHG